MVPNKELEERYYHFALLPQNLFFKEPDSMGCLTIPAKTILSLENKLQREIATVKLLNDCAE